MVSEDPDATLAKWRSWIEGPIRSDVVDMHFKRLIWREIAAMMDANPTVGEMPSAFWDFHKDSYAVAQAIAVRRQADRDPRTCSLGVLIGEMRDNAQLLTRENYVALLGDRAADELMRQRADADFTKVAGDGDHLDPTIADEYLAALRNAADRVRTYVNQHVAHDQAHPTMTEAPTFADLHEAIDAIGKIFQKVAVTLTGGWNALEPVIQGDWQAIFREPWISSP